MNNAHEYSGREAKHELNFRKWSESKHAQYFTPIKLAHTIAECVSCFVPLSDLTVLDPSCGSGRLLKPFRDAGSRVLGVELDRETAVYAKRALGSDNVRVGDICDYRHHLKYKFDLVVANPPYGILWKPDGEFRTSRYDGSVESQSASLEIAAEALQYTGLLVAIIPTTTFTNAKDKQIKEYLFKQFYLITRITLENLFLQEYNIAPKVDLVFAQRFTSIPEQQASAAIEALDYRDSDVHDRILEIVHEAAQAESLNISVSADSAPPLNVPDLSVLHVANPDPVLRITDNGITGDAATMLFARFLDKSPAYHPALGRETGAFDAFCSPPALLKRGVAESEFFVRAVGFEVAVSDNARMRLEKLRQKFARLAIPVYRPQPHQLLAYFDEKAYVAKATIPDPENDDAVLFKKNKKYRLRPGWVRNRQTVKREVKTVKDRLTTFIHDVDRGYLGFSVQTESGLRECKEIDKNDVELLTQAFGLPEIKDLADHFPEQVAANRKRIAETFPFLFDYQREDLARLTLKDGVYLGYEMGGGKTVTGACWAALKGYRRILVICQPGAVANWLRELRKFGFLAHELLDHRAVDKMLKSSKPDMPTYYVTSYQFLSLDTQRVYDPWDCIKHDKNGKAWHVVKGNCARTCADCGRRFDLVQRECPQCGDLEQWTGNFCHRCGCRPWTYSSGSTQYPAYKRLKNRVFDGLLVDEAQEAKNKNSLRGRAVRAIKTKGIALLTGTLMKGYISDVFWNIGNLVGFGNLLFPYPYCGGAKMFLDEFGTYEYVSKQFEDTLHEGRAKLLPEVSNLNRFWRLLASFTVRRLKDSMVSLPPKKRHFELIPMDMLQAEAYRKVETWAQEEIQTALRHEEPNMGKISGALWKLRFAATQPADRDKLGDVAISAHTWAKLDCIVALVREMKSRKEKVVIFSSLRSMVTAISRRLKDEGLYHVTLTASTSVNKRLTLIDGFQNYGHVALVAGTNCANRAFTITAANNVIIANLEFSPEPTVQAEDRVHRTGQTRPVNVHYLFSERTIDQDMWELVTKKGEAIQNAVDMKARDRTVADLLQSKTELAVAERLLERKDEPPTIPETNGTTTPPELKRVQPPRFDHLQLLSKPVASMGDGEQLDLFVESA